MVSHFVNLQIVVPEATIQGGNGEHHVDVGSVIDLVCIIDKSPTPPQYVFWYHNNHMINYDTARGGITVETVPGLRTQSRLIIRDTNDADSGNYTCSASNTEPASIYVFVSEDSPGEFYINSYIQTLLQYDVKVLVRVCKKTYEEMAFTSQGIQIEEFNFPNGSFPDKAIIDKWLCVCKAYAKNHPSSTLAIHCESGLGRSAVLVAVALIDAGMKPDQVIDFIRNKRRGAFNSIQYECLRNYAPKTKSVEKKKNRKGQKCCIL
ncbi:hypothetical protein Trydic_g15536 [Trypoxylus dichotomus]